MQLNCTINTPVLALCGRAIAIGSAAFWAATSLPLDGLNSASTNYDGERLWHPRRYRLRQYDHSPPLDICK